MDLESGNPTQKRTSSTADKLELTYWLRRADADKNRYLLLLHGGASNHTRWSEFVEHTSLTAGWNILFPDMRGNGESMTRRHLNMDTWCADLVDILDAENAATAVIAGHSLGAQIAINFARRNPDKTTGLVLIDPVFRSALRGRPALIRRYRWPVKVLANLVGALNRLGLHRRNIQDRDLRELDEETRQAIRGDETFEQIAKRYGALGPILRHMPTANYLRQALATVHTLPPLAEIKVPVVVLLSGGTSLASLELNRAEVAQFSDSEIVTLEANHWPLTETPQATRAAIDDWVSRKFGP